MIFDINKNLKTILETIPELKGKLFPLVAENSTTFPFVIYQRTNTDFRNISKDNCTYIHTFTVSVITDNYSKMADLANRVFDLLNNKIYGQYGIDFLAVDNAVESYEDGAFVVDFTVIITKTI